MVKVVGKELERMSQSLMVDLILLGAHAISLLYTRMENYGSC